MLPIRESSALSRRLKRMLAGLIPFDVVLAKVSTGSSANIAYAGPLPLATAVDGHPADLVISTGPRTAAANIAVARRLGAKNVYFGLSQWPSDRFFSLLLTPERRTPSSARRLCTSALRDRRRRPARCATARTERRGAPRRAALRRAVEALFLHDGGHGASCRAGRRAHPRAALAEVDDLRFPPHACGGVRAPGAADRSRRRAGGVRPVCDRRAALQPAGVRLRPCSGHRGFHVDARRGNRRASAGRNSFRGRATVRRNATLSSRRRSSPTAGPFRLRFSGLVAEALISGAADLRVLQGSELDALYDTLARHGI